MRFFDAGISELVIILAYILPLVLLVWFIRAVNAVVDAQREIAARLAAIEEKIRRPG